MFRHTPTAEIPPCFHKLQADAEMMANPADAYDPHLDSEVETLSKQMALYKLNSQGDTMSTDEKLATSLCLSSINPHPNQERLIKSPPPLPPPSPIDWEAIRAAVGEPSPPTPW